MDEDKVMDQNELLTEIMKICDLWNEWGEYELHPPTTLDSLVDYISQLNNIMSLGETPPDAWS